MKKLTLEEFGALMKKALWYYNDTATTSEPWRLGQSIINTLRHSHPEVCSYITATDADCFHQDSKIIHFVNAILES